MSDKNLSTGKKGEDIAIAFLEDKGWLILDRNYSFMKKELDIVGSTDREIVFVEVKTRSNSNFGEPEDALTDQKKRNLIETAQAWLHERKLEGAPVRFDVIAIIAPGSKKQKIRHHEGAFWYL